MEQSDILKINVEVLQKNGVLLNDDLQEVTELINHLNQSNIKYLVSIINSPIHASNQAYFKFTLS